MAAYENIGKMLFYLGNIKKANYYHERSIRGKEEVINSKVRQLSEIVYVKKMRDRDEKFLTFHEIRKKLKDSGKEGTNFLSNYEYVKMQLDKLPKKLMQI